MYQSTTDPSRKFGSAFRGKAFDSYHAGPQPGEENDNSHAVSQEPDGASGAADVSAAMPDAGSVVAEHGPAISTHYTHDHEGGKHTVTSTHNQGHQTATDHSSADEAYSYGSKLSLEEGGEDSWKDTKKRLHPDQQGADSEERNYEAIGSAGA